jgi:hypothetical protein
MEVVSKLGTVYVSTIFSLATLQVSSQTRLRLSLPPQLSRINNSLHKRPMHAVSLPPTE